MKGLLFIIHLTGVYLTAPTPEQMTFTRFCQSMLWEATILYYELPPWFERNVYRPAALRDAEEGGE